MMKPTHEGNNYRLYHGDCLDVLPTLKAGSVDAVIADPPYGTTACGWDSVIPFAPMWDAIKHVIKPRAGVVLFGSQPFTSALVMSNPSWFKYCWVWEKTNSSDFMLTSYRPRQIFEDIAVFSRNSHNYYPQMEVGEPYIDKPRRRTNNIADSTMPKLGIVNNGTRYPSAVQKFANPNNGILHPTQKPVALMEYLIRTYTNEGDTVLDFTIGSGSTGVAAVKNGRYFIGVDNGHCEKEGELYGVPWVDIARTRIANAAGDYCPAPKDSDKQLALFWEVS